MKLCCFVSTIKYARGSSPSKSSFLVSRNFTSVLREQAQVAECITRDIVFLFFKAVFNFDAEYSRSFVSAGSIPEKNDGHEGRNRTSEREKERDRDRKRERERRERGRREEENEREESFREMKKKNVQTL